MAELFKVEELQERLEFGDWTASASADSSGTVSGTVTYSPDWGEVQ